MCNRRGFTLIELLIVVAIIAILAAIAVPNFLEAQVRSKVSRTLADMRTVVTALESYAVDHNRYPETDLGLLNLSNNFLGPVRLTTPVAYLTSLPGSPWNENLGSESGNPKIASGWNGFLYVRALAPTGSALQFPPQDDT
ncbi:MAG: prepilin-type N-terminal cleavage/methylation domain-containing protein, partial [Candidatus Sumerlaeia bacterium]|nr:prepilin-type N-terminal cleavage/methylation domain-containing protein [Candidatus Sumerlaeia bacterium]